MTRVWDYDIMDPDAFPEAGIRVWTLIIFGCLTQDAIVSNPDSNLHGDRLLSGSMFAMMVVFTGIMMHCSYTTISHWSGVHWNWGQVWVYVVLMITEFCLLYTSPRPRD